MADRNLPIINLPVAPGTYSQKDQDSLRLAIRQHWHLGGGGGSASNMNSFATVILPLDNGSNVITSGMFVTIPITFGYTITGYRLIEDCGLTGSIEIRVDYATDTDFPTFTAISGTQNPTLVGARAQERTLLDGWSSTVGQAYSQLRATAIGDATNLTRVELAIALQRVDSATASDATGGGSSTDDDSGMTGTVWHDGTGAPAGALGNDGDYYLNDTNDDVYHKSGGVWTIVTNIGGTPGSGGAVPTLVAAGTSFTVATNFQALFTVSVGVEGLLIVNGVFAMVD